MEHRNGIGSILYGKKNKHNDGSYQAVEWVIFFFLPLVPLGTYRVRRIGDSELTTTNGIFVGASTPYEMVKIKMDWVQVLTTFFSIYVIAFLLFIGLYYLSGVIY